MRDLVSQSQAIVEKGSYVTPSGREIELGSWIEATLRGTKLYTPASLIHLMREEGPRGYGPEVQVFDTTTAQAAKNLVVDLGVEKPALLCFADRETPGGPFLKGGRSQEATLCRCSALFPALKSQKSYYHEHRQEKSRLGTDHIIYAPDVVFFKETPHGPLLEAPFRVSVMCATAPKMGPLRRKDSDLRKLFRSSYERRWGAILAVAEAEGHRHLLLGDWGCDVFENQPQDCAETLAPWLSSERFRGSFQQIVIAISSDTAKGKSNLEVFRDCLA